MLSKPLGSIYIVEKSKKSLKSKEEMKREKLRFTLLAIVERDK
jgi:hypothetical protein